MPVALFFPNCSVLSYSSNEAALCFFVLTRETLFKVLYVFSGQEIEKGISSLAVESNRLTFEVTKDKKQEMMSDRLVIMPQLFI